MGHKVEGNKVIIEFDPASTQLSKSGKTYLLASSGGFVWINDKKGAIGISYNIVRERESKTKRGGIDWEYET